MGRATGLERLTGVVPVVVAVVSVGFVGCVIGFSVLLSRAAEPIDGNQLARERVESLAASLQDSFGDRRRVRDAEHVAATTTLPSSGYGEDHIRIRIDYLGWSGRTFGDEQATIDIRFEVTVAARGANSFSERGNTAGQATACYRYVLQLYRHTGRTEIDCPAGATPRHPTAGPVPTLPADARARVAAALADATPRSLATDVRSAFPEEHVTVDTAVAGDVLVAAVGVPMERECVLAVRTADGAIEYPGFRRIWLEPGEVGCKTTLYTNPPR